jgi:hypothetical protein
LTRQYAGHGLEAIQWRSGVEDQTTKSRSQLTFSPKQHFAQQLDVLQQQNPNKYLQWQRCHKNSSAQTRKEGVERKPTSQQLASRLDNAKNERLALLIMNNLRHQAGNLFFKGRDFLHIATGLVSLFNSHLCLAFGQG